MRERTRQGCRPWARPTPRGTHAGAQRRRAAPEPRSHTPRPEPPRMDARRLGRRHGRRSPFFRFFCLLKIGFTTAQVLLRNPHHEPLKRATIASPQLEFLLYTGSSFTQIELYNPLEANVSCSHAARYTPHARTWLCSRTPEAGLSPRFLCGLQSAFFCVLSAHQHPLVFILCMNISLNSARALPYNPPCDTCLGLRFFPTRHTRP